MRLRLVLKSVARLILLGCKAKTLLIPGMQASAALRVQ
jgi:hypothetical protein